MEKSRDEDAATKRRELMGLLARASRAQIVEGLTRLGAPIDFEDLRAPEIGLVMLRGRIAGSGAPFNLGEATVVRAAVRLPTGQTGFSYVLGRDGEKARLAAAVDALWADEAQRAEVEEKLIAPLRAHFIEKERQDARRTAATKVDFFTMTRGEDET
jgi:alpha-D-ribose 1-methylphosphonate 5-triphosphate synthase subunit PhnG